VLVDALAVKVVGHAGQLDLAVQRLVAHAQQGAVGHAEAEAPEFDTSRHKFGGRSSQIKHLAAVFEFYCGGTFI
jgi:hypothetical protein